MKNFQSKISFSEKNNLRTQFIKWQCRVRQISMRENFGRPDDSISQLVFLPNAKESYGKIVTILSKEIAFSKIPELNHIVKRTFDPLQRREKAIEFFSETYFQKHKEFSDILTATFQPNSIGAETIIKNGLCKLIFDSYSQKFELHCKVKKLESSNPFFREISEEIKLSMSYKEPANQKSKNSHK